MALTGQGVLKSLRPVNRRLYDFSVSADGRQLTITETDLELDGQVRLELLAVEADGSCGQWGAELPVCLRELYSHWFCR